MGAKRKIAFSFVVLTVLTALSGCPLFNGINLAWNIDSVVYLGGLTRVGYTVQNLGKYDLKSVNLQIGVDINGNLTYPLKAWTMDFNIDQNQILHGSLDLLTGVAPAGWATVLSIDMDNPES